MDRILAKRIPLASSSYIGGDMTGSTYLMKVLNRLEKYQIENGTRKRIEVTYIPTRDEYVKVEGLGNRLYWKPF